MSDCPGSGPGCCSVCEGSGTDRGSPETGGKCWDCLGTGHPHPIVIPAWVTNVVAVRPKTEEEWDLS